MNEVLEGTFWEILCGSINTETKVRISYYHNNIITSSIVCIHEEL